MATVTASIKEFENMSKVLQKLTKTTGSFIRKQELLYSTMARLNSVMGSAVVQQRSLNREIKKGSGALSKLATSTQSLQNKVTTGVKEINNMARGVQNLTKNTSSFIKAQSKFKVLNAIRPTNPATPNQASAPDQGSGNASGRASKLTSAVKMISDSLFSMQGVEKLLGSTVGGAAEQQKTKAMFIAKTGDTDIGTAMFDKFKSEAKAAGQDVNKSLQGTLSLLPVTTDMDQLTKLNDLAKRMAAFDTGGNGIEGSTSILKETMNGDTSTLATRYNIPESDIQQSKVAELGKSGNVEGMTKAFDQLLSNQNMGQEEYSVLMASPAEQVGMLNNNFNSAMADAGGSALQVLAPLITMLNEAFQSGKFQPFFDTLSNGLALVAEGVAWITNSLFQVVEVFSSNWGTIEPILWGIVAAMSAWLIITELQAIAQGLLVMKTTLSTLITFAQTVATLGLNTAWQTLNATMKANMIMFIISALIGLGVWLYKLWQTNDQFAAGLMRAWNTILNFFDQIPIFFAIVGMGIVNAFQWAKVKSLELLDMMVNGYIDGINWLIEKLNEIPGINLETIGNVDFSSNAAKEADAIRQAGEKAIAGMKESAAARKIEREQKAVEMENRTSRRAKEDKEKEQEPKAVTDLNKWNTASNKASNTASNTASNVASNTAPNINRVGEVGKITDSVDVSSEDLKVMRELAEMKNIQNFVSLKPSVNVKTGAVNNGMDIDTIIRRIEKNLEEQIAVSAEGVYS